MHDLVRGVNVEEGTYAGRTGRVLNFAARRTPIANADSARDLFDNILFESAEDSFDRAETAVERLIAGNFSPTSLSGTEFRGRNYPRNSVVPSICLARYWRPSQILNASSVQCNYGIT